MLLRKVKVIELLEHSVSSEKYCFTVLNRWKSALKFVNDHILGNIAHVGFVLLLLFIMPLISGAVFGNYVKHKNLQLDFYYH